LSEEGIDYHLGREEGGSLRGYLEKAEKNRGEIEIEKQPDRICNAIRERIGLLELITSSRD